MREFENFDVMEKFQLFDGIQKKRLLQLREMIFDVADADNRIKPLSEDLRWGDPSYITKATQSGTTIRLGLFDAEKIALFFNCNTTLVDTFRHIYADQLEFSKNRAVVIDPCHQLNKNILSRCIHASLTYKLKS